MFPEADASDGSEGGVAQSEAGEPDMGEMPASADPPVNQPPGDVVAADPPPAGPLVVDGSEDAPAVTQPSTASLPATVAQPSVEPPALPEWSPTRPEPLEPSTAAPTAELLPTGQQPSDMPSADEPPPLDPPTIDPPAIETPPAAAPSTPLPALPSTPVDVNNTRHLTWLLGSKVSLAALNNWLPADPGRAGADGVADGSMGQDGWQVDAIAELLTVTPPSNPSIAAAEQTPARAVGALLSDARRLGDELHVRHGADHAALLEVAVKTNVLLLLYEKNRALAAPVKRAVVAAGDRAKLPESTWRPLVTLLGGSPSSGQLRAEVFRLHSDIERVLRTGGE